MTGEITLRGRVLAIGGLREKTMGALRGGMSTVIIPADNGKDLEDIDQTVRKSLTFVQVHQADEVLAQALTSNLPIQIDAAPCQSPETPCAVGHAVNLRQ